VLVYGKLLRWGKNIYAIRKYMDKIQKELKAGPHDIGISTLEQNLILLFKNVADFSWCYDSNKG